MVVTVSLVMGRPDFGIVTLTVVVELIESVTVVWTTGVVALDIILVRETVVDEIGEVV